MSILDNLKDVVKTVNSVPKFGILGDKIMGEKHGYNPLKSLYDDEEDEKKEKKR